MRCREWPPFRKRELGLGLRAYRSRVLDPQNHIYSVPKVSVVQDSIAVIRCNTPETVGLAYRISFGRYTVKMIAERMTRTVVGCSSHDIKLKMQFP